MADDTGRTDVPPKPSTYEKWQQDQGVRVVSGHHIADLRAVDLDRWDRIGGRGVFINHDASDSSNDCHLVEIPGGKALEPEHHLYEEMIYVLSGFGATTVWNPDGTTQTFEWQTGSLFAMPLNARHQHHNATADQAARMLCVTNAPTVMNLFQSVDFVFGVDWAFDDRFDGTDGYFSGEGSLDGWLLETNFVPDARRIELVDYPLRGAGGRKVELSLAGNTMGAHIAQFPTGTYKKAHRHGPGAHLIVLSGVGYTLMWENEGDEPTKYDWSEGGLVIPPDRWFHQHFNSGPEPARYLALRYQANRPKAANGVPLSRLSTKLGGDQIDYEDEHPRVREIFEEEVAKHGAVSKMGDVVAAAAAKR